MSITRPVIRRLYSTSISNDQVTRILSNAKIQSLLAGIPSKIEALNQTVEDAHTKRENTSSLTESIKELHRLNKIAAAHQNFSTISNEIEELQKIATQSDDEELKSFALEELSDARTLLAKRESELIRAMAPKDDADDASAILEIRAATGGDESGRFAYEVLRMYERYATRRGWRSEMLQIGMDPYDHRSLKEASLSITGPGVFGALKYESGVHRVQRVPGNDAAGRIHTSTITVAVLPQPTDIQLKIDPAELRIEAKRAGGAGGQHVNKTESAIKITHLPTGITVVMQEDRSQHKNRAKAMHLLKARLYQMEREKVMQARAKSRSSQIGMGMRSEKIRTYNYPQSRCTDHRIGYTTQQLEELLNGGDELDSLMSALAIYDEIQFLENSLQ